MSIFEVLNRLGTLALLRFAAAIALFLLLHLLRIPLVLLAKVLKFSLLRIDRYATKQATRPARPINHFYDPTGEEIHGVHA